MARNSDIEWTHHTFNPWWGCAKVSPACANCYAEQWARRVGQSVWGKRAKRRKFGESHWREPIIWDRAAGDKGHRERVFCASMADVFESRQELNSERRKLWDLIECTPNLDWLLLTKRPENVSEMVPWSNGIWPKNVWLGATVENQEMAELRLPHLLSHNAAIRFLSCEPLLGPVDLRPWFHRTGLNPIDWVIAGGESGANARPMHPDWVRRMLDHCQDAEVAFHFKQWGHWVPAEIVSGSKRLISLKLPEESPVEIARLPKKKAGRTLAGRIWDGLPSVNDARKRGDVVT